MGKFIYLEKYVKMSLINHYLHLTILSVKHEVSLKIKVSRNR